MSEENKKGVKADMPKDTRTVTLEIKEFVWKRLEAQINFLNGMRIPELSSITKPEDLLLFYVEQLCLPAQHQREVHKKVGEVLQLFHKKGVNMRQLLNAFTFEEDDADDGESEEDDLGEIG